MSKQPTPHKYVADPEPTGPKRVNVHGAKIVWVHEDSLVRHVGRLALVLEPGDILRAFCDRGELLSLTAAERARILEGFGKY